MYITGEPYVFVLKKRTSLSKIASPDLHCHPTYELSHIIYSLQRK
jgi:hypothetical protein